MKKWILAIKIIFHFIKEPSKSYLSVVEKVYNDELQKNPNDYYLIWFLSNQYIRHKKYEEAEYYLELLFKSQKASRNVVLLLFKVYFNLQKYEKVIFLLENTNHLKNSDVENYYIGYSLMGLNRYSEAEKYLSNYTTHFPRDYVGHVRLGYIYFMEGKYQEALDTYGVSEKLRPDLNEIKEGIRLCYEKINEPIT